jgi:hypothetical protein
LNISGTDHARGALIDVSGNGDNFIVNQFVCWQMSLQGNGNYTVPWESGIIMPVRGFKPVE